VFFTIAREKASGTDPKRVFYWLLLALAISIILYVGFLTNFVDLTASRTWTQLNWWLAVASQLVLPVFLGVLVSFLGQTARICSLQKYNVSVTKMLVNGVIGLALALFLAAVVAGGLYLLAPRLEWLTIDPNTTLTVFFPISTFLLGLYSGVGLQLPAVLRDSHQVEGRGMTVGQRVIRFLLVIGLSLMFVIIIGMITISGIRLDSVP